MVSASLRQEVDWAPARNAIDGLERGVPPWAIPGYRAAPDAPPPLSPWDEWPMPPKRPDHFAAKIRRRPTPGDAVSEPPTEPSPQHQGATGASLAWRVAFDQPERSATMRTATATRPDRAATVRAAESDAASAATWRDQETTGTAKRLVLFLGLAYLLLTALVTGIVWTGYAVPGHRREPDDTTPPVPWREPDAHAPPQRELEPTAPGLHTGPDRTRYLIMPLPADVADRLRGTGRAFALGSAQ